MAFIKVTPDYENEMVINTKAIVRITKVFGTNRIFFSDGAFFDFNANELEKIFLSIRRENACVEIGNFINC